MVGASSLFLWQILTLYIPVDHEYNPTTFTSQTLPTATTITTTPTTTTTTLSSTGPSPYSAPTSVLEPSTQVQQDITTLHSTAVSSGNPSPSSSTLSNDRGSSQGSRGLSTEGIFGIVGSLAAVLTVAIALWPVLEYRKRQRAQPHTEQPANTEEAAGTEKG